MKIALIDFETTSLDPDKHGEIIEIGAVIFDSETGQVFETIDVKVLPDFPFLGSEEAFKVNGYDAEVWKNSAYTKKRAMELFFLKTQGCVFAAWNVTFDWTFYRAFLKECNAEDWFAGRKICIMSMAYDSIPHASLKSFSLKNVCEYLDLMPEPEVHRAINGATCAYQVYKKIQGI